MDLIRTRYGSTTVQPTRSPGQVGDGNLVGATNVEIVSAMEGIRRRSALTLGGSRSMAGHSLNEEAVQRSGCCENEGLIRAILRRIKNCHD